MCDPPHLDRFLPVWDLRSLVGLDVPGPRRAVYRALRAISLAEVPLLYSCLRLRAIPARLIGRAGPVFRASSPILEGFVQNGFIELAEAYGRAYSIGGIGAFWRLVDNQPIRTLAGPRDFTRFDQPGYVKVASCHLVREAGAGCRLDHEIRMAGTSPEATARFRRYWRLVGHVSVVLRKSSLEVIRRNLEADGPR